MISLSQRKTLPYWQSIRHIADKVIATIEQREGFPPELRTSSQAAIALVNGEIENINRALRSTSRAA